MRPNKLVTKNLENVNHTYKQVNFTTSFIENVLRTNYILGIG